MCSLKDDATPQLRFQTLPHKMELSRIKIKRMHFVPYYLEKSKKSVWYVQWMNTASMLLKNIYRESISRPFFFVNNMLTKIYIQVWHYEVPFILLLKVRQCAVKIMEDNKAARKKVTLAVQWPLAAKQWLILQERVLKAYSSTEKSREMAQKMTHG